MDRNTACVGGVPRKQSGEIKIASSNIGACILRCVGSCLKVFAINFDRAFTESKTGFGPPE
jgi:hypothetical protein